MYEEPFRFVVMIVGVLGVLVFAHGQGNSPRCSAGHCI